MAPGSITGGVTGFFSDIFLPTVPWPWGRLRPWRKWVPGTFTGGVKATDACGWQPYRLHMLNVMKIWELKPSGTLWATPGLLRDFFTFTFYFDHLMFYLLVSGADPGSVNRAEQILSSAGLSWVMNQRQQVRIICEVINIFFAISFIMFLNRPWPEDY